MNRLTLLFSQLLILGAFICLTSAVSLRHKRNVIAEYHWPEPDPTINQFPHETTCHYYYLVLSEDDITVNKCPDGQLFDYKFHKCVDKENAQCWSHHFGKMKHHHMRLKSRGHFKCPYAWGKYPDIRDCTRYFVCLNGKVKHKKCAPFEHFDKVSRKCVAEIEGVCADKSDIGDPEYKCPRTWGSFSFDEDCSKYYECLEKRPSLRTCPTDTLFHERKEKCLPHKHVHCGSRRNPYRIKEKTLITIDPENPQASSSQPTVPAKEKKPEVETKSTPDPNSIIIERYTSIPDNSPSSKKLTTVSKVVHPESNLVASSKRIVTSNDMISKPTKNEVTKESVTSTADPNSIVIPTMSVNKLETNQTETKQTVEELPAKETITTKGSTELPAKQITNKVSTNLPITQSSNKESTDLPVKEMTNPEATNSSMKQSATNKEVVKVSAKPTAEDDLSTILPVERKVTDSEATDLPNKTSVPKEQTNKKPAKEMVPNETELPVKINTEAMLENDTDDVTNNDEEVTDEFIEVSTAEEKSSSLLATETVVADSTENPKKEEIKDEQTTAEPPQATPMEECDPKDPTCATNEKGQVLRCPEENGCFPYPNDERRFLFCDKSNIMIKFCESGTIFSDSKKTCIGRLIFS